METATAEAEETEGGGYLVSVSPNVRAKDDVGRLMWAVVIALAPAWGWGMYAFGWYAGAVVVGLMLFGPLYLHAAAWQAGFGGLGWYTLATGTEKAWLSGWTGAIWVHALAGVPWVVLIVGAGLWLIEPELEEQALLDGSPGQVFSRVTLRSAAPAVGVAAVWVAITTAGEMAATDLFVVRTYAEEIYMRFQFGPGLGEGPLSLAPGVVLTGGLVLGGLWLCTRLLPAGRPITLARRYVFTLGRWRWPLAVVVAAALLLLVAVPLGNLAYKAGITVTQVGTERVREWSPLKMLAMVGSSPWRYRRELGASLSIAALAATAAVALATLLGWFSQRGAWFSGKRLLQHREAPRTAVRWATFALAAFCLAVPGPLVGLGLIAALNRPEVPALAWLYNRSILAPWLALSIRAFPLAVLVAWHALRTVPREMLDAAAVDGAGSLERLVFVALPNRLAALGLAWVVALAVALGDLGASVMVLPPGVDTLSRRIFGLLHSGQEAEVAGICLALVILFGATALLAGWLAVRWGQRAAAGGSRALDRV